MITRETKLIKTEIGIVSISTIPDPLLSLEVDISALNDQITRFRIPRVQIIILTIFFSA
jgi:hypothetical protein